MIRILFVVVLFMGLIGCSSGDVEVPRRPENVPENAEWYGGSDGGAWYVVSASLTENHFMLEIYNDYKGLVWAKGEFMLDPNCSIDSVFTVDEIRRSISFWTGEVVGLGIHGDDGSTCSLILVSDALGKDTIIEE